MPESPDEQQQLRSLRASIGANARWAKESRPKPPPEAELQALNAERAEEQRAKLAALKAGDDS